MYPSHSALIAALLREEPAAIRHLSERVMGVIAAEGRRFGLSAEDREELHTDCLLIFIEKLRSGTYVDQGYDPASYVVAIARRRVFHYRRKLARVQVVDWDEEALADALPQYAGAEDAGLLEALLKQMDPGCQRLIRLRYLEGWKDKEILKEGWTPYSTTASLKNHGSRCWRALIRLGQAYFIRESK